MATSLRRMAGLVAPMAAFRWLVVGCQAATVLITWPLWQLRAAPPMIPAVPLPQADCGIPLLLSLAAILVRPRAGVVAHTVVVLYAVLVDQTRLQPELVSLLLLLWGSLPSPGAQTLGRAHLVSMWIFAGLNKLLSPAFLHGTAQWILAGLVPNAPPPLREHVGYLIAFSELGLGLAALAPPTRKLAAALALLLHGAILADLSPLGHDWNEAVWPWNVALAFAGFALIAPWKEHPLRALSRCHALARVAAIMLVIAPAGFYVTLTDAYLAHNLYSSNTLTTTWCDARRRCAGDRPTTETWEAFNVPLPPEHRILEAYFTGSCRSGDTLTIRDSRWWARVHGFDRRVLTCP